MKVLRIYTGPDNESHFEDKEIPLDLPGRGSVHNSPIKVADIKFIEGNDDLFYDYHTAPQRQFVIALEGQCELEIPGGAKRVINPGEILLAEDTTGHGHISRHYNHFPGKKPWRVAFIPFI